MTDDHDDRTLDLAGVLAELQALIGKRVSVESASEATNAFHESGGVLGRSIDLQIATGSPLEKPAWIAFHLDDTDAHFVVREARLRSAVAYTVEFAEGPSRTVQLHFDGGGVLIVREDLG